MADILIVAYQGGGAPLRLANIWYYNQYPEDTSAATPTELGNLFVLKNTYKPYSYYARPSSLYWHSRDDQASDPSALGDQFILKNQYRPYSGYSRPQSLYFNPPQDITPTTPNAEGSFFLARPAYNPFKQYARSSSIYNHARDDQAATPSEPGIGQVLKNTYKPYAPYKIPSGFYGFYRDDSVPPPPPGSSKSDGVLIICYQDSVYPKRLSALWYYSSTAQDNNAPDVSEPGRDFVLRNIYKPGILSRSASLYWTYRDDSAAAPQENGRDFVLRNIYKPGKYQYQTQLNWFYRDDQLLTPNEPGRDFVLRNQYKPFSPYTRSVTIQQYSSLEGTSVISESGRDFTVRAVYNPTTYAVGLYISGGDSQADDPFEPGRDFTIRNQYKATKYSRFGLFATNVEGGVSVPPEFGRDFTLYNNYKINKYFQPRTVNYRDDQALDSSEPGRDFVLRNLYQPGKYRYNYSLGQFQRDDSLLVNQEVGRDFTLRNTYKASKLVRPFGFYNSSLQGQFTTPGESGRDFVLRNFYKSYKAYSRPITLYSAARDDSTFPPIVPPLPPPPPTPVTVHEAGGGQYIFIKTIGKDLYLIVHQDLFSNRPDATGHEALYWAFDQKRMYYDDGQWNDLSNGVSSVTRFITGGSGTDTDPFVGWDQQTPWQSHQTYEFESGMIYACSVTPPWNDLVDVRLRGNGATIRFTGTGPGITFYNNTYNNSPGWTVEDFLFQGSASVTDLVLIKNMHRSTFRSLRGINCTGNVFRISGPVLSIFERVVASSTYGDQTVTPLHGFLLETSGGVQTTNGCTFTQCMAEGTSGTGWVMTGAAINGFFNGTSENCLRGYDLQNATCYANSFVSCDAENNSSGEDWLLSGSYGNTILSCQSTGTIHVAVNSFANKVSGGYHQSVLVDAGAFDNKFEDMAFNVTLTGTFVDNGTYTTILNVRDQINGFMIPNQISQKGADLTFVTGSNGDFALTGTLAVGEHYRILGPGGAFDLSGLNPIPGLGMSRNITFINTTASTFTIKYNDAVGCPTASHRFFCPGGADFVVGGVLKTVTVRYDSGYNRWLIIGSS